MVAMGSVPSYPLLVRRDDDKSKDDWGRCRTWLVTDIARIRLRRNVGRRWREGRRHAESLMKGESTIY